MKKLIYLLLWMGLWGALEAVAQKRPPMLEKQLEMLRREPDNVQALHFLCQYYADRGDGSKTITYAEILKNVADRRQSPLLHLYSCLYQAQVQMMSGREKVAKKNLSLSLELATALHNDSALCAVYRTMGQYAAQIETDYYQAIRWMYKGIQLAQQNKFTQQYALLLGNLAGIYYLKRDPEGLKYALECYELGHSLRHPYLIYSGAINVAYLYALRKQNDEAVKYLHEAEDLMIANDFYDRAHIYNLFGNMLSENKEYRQAIGYFRKAMKERQSAQTSSVVYAHLGYARALMQLKQYEEAIVLLKQGIAISYARVNAVYRNELYETLSSCYEHIHLYPEALDSYKVFRKENDSLFNKDRERDLNEMRFRYDSERQENLIKQSKLDVMRKEQRIQQQSFGLILVILVLGLLYYLYYRKNKLYLSIVKQNQETIKREKEWLRRIRELEADRAPDRYVSSSLSDEKSLDIFRTLERLMQEEKIYKDHALNKDKLAEILGTNRTYLSRIINEQTELSFTHYVNRYRMDEALRRLSDAADQTPLKALAAELGFNSLSTFYHLFQARVGMTPSQYRNKVMELGK